jgi:hypothetical protein
VAVQEEFPCDEAGGDKNAHTKRIRRCRYFGIVSGVFEPSALAVAHRPETSSDGNFYIPDKRLEHRLFHVNRLDAERLDVKVNRRPDVI